MIGAVPLSHDPSGYSSGLLGTSFSAPIVSAAAAWIWTERPSLDAGQVADILRRSARDLAPPGFDPSSGWGLLDIPAALAAPAPAPDPEEPNDDVDQVKPGALFPSGQPMLTTPARPGNRIAGTLDANEDPVDLYRIWVPAHHTVRVSVTGSDRDAVARIWGPLTSSVDEGIAARRRDLEGTAVTAGARGFSAYAEVLLSGRSANAGYVLSVQPSTH